jgi:pimeloyl-ACP methyl ester carboxylesterase
VPTLSVDGASVAYSDTEAPDARPDAPSVVFGHGLLFGGWAFGAQIEALRSDYRCIAIDWRGQGDSPAAASGYDMDTLAGDAIALIEQVTGPPVHYVGLSMGGFVGQRIAARRPELIRSLTLLDTSADPETARGRVEYPLLSVIYRLLGPNPVRRSVEKVMLGPAFRADPRSKAIVDDWMQRLGRCERAGVQRAVLGVANRSGVAHEIGAITAPTLVAVGDHDAATAPDRARRIAELIPGARLEIIRDSGHSSSIEQPEAVSALIRSFLAEVDAGRGDRARTD